MEIESLQRLVSRKIAQLLRAAAPRTPWWENATSAQQIADILCQNDPSIRNILDSIGELDSTLALHIHQELIVDEDIESYYLSTLLTTLETFIAAPRSYEEIFSCSAFYGIVDFLPPSTTHLNLRPLPQHQSFDHNFFVKLSNKAHIAGQLRHLELCANVLPLHFASLEKFTSLRSLKLEADMPFTVLPSLLKMTGLEDLSLCLVPSNDREKSLDAILTVIGDDKDHLALPNLVSFSFSNPLNEEGVDRILAKILPHPASSELRRFPVSCWFENADKEGTITIPSFDYATVPLGDLIRDLQNNVERTLLQVVTQMPFESLTRPFAWSTLEKVLPKASNLRELVLETKATPGAYIDGRSDPSLCVVLSQDKVDFLATNLPNLRCLSVCCPVPNNVSLAALSKLTELRADPSSLPKPLRFMDQHRTLPESLRVLKINYGFVINPAGWINALKPLVNLTDLQWSATAFGYDEFDEFMSVLSKQLTRLQITESLEKTKTNPAVPHVVRINLPKLIELEIRSDLLCQKLVSFEFTQAPRLRTLRYKSTIDQALLILSSLSKFPSAKESLRKISLPSLSGTMASGDSSPSMMMALANTLRDFPNLQSLDLSKSFVTPAVTIALKDCTRISALQLRGLNLPDSDLSELMGRLPFLVSLVLYDASGFDGFSWMKHSRLERLDVSVTSFLDADAAPAGSEDALKLYGSDLPRLRALSVYIGRGNRGDKDDRVKVLSGFPFLNLVTIMPCSTLIVENTPELEILNLTFSGPQCMLRLKNAPELKYLDAMINEDVNKFSLSDEIEFPSLTSLFCMTSSPSVEGMDLLEKIIKVSPNVQSVKFNNGGDNEFVIDPDRLWALSSTLQEIDTDGDSYKRPEL